MGTSRALEEGKEGKVSICLLGILVKDLLGHHFAHIIGVEIRIGHLGRRGIVDGQVLDLATIVELRHCQPKQTQTRMNEFK